MKCIFCGLDSSGSKSVEHIIPESFGNSTAVLPKGVVCDKCNNYFGREVESPFLNSKAVLLLRQELQLEKKNGKVLNLSEYPFADSIVKQVSDQHYLVYTRDDMSEEMVHNSVVKYQHYVEETDNELLKPNIHMSRMLGKMALETFVFRCGVESGVCDYIREDDVFKPLRMYVRFDSRKMWKYSSRRIYSRARSYNGDPNTHVNWEYDFLFLPNGEVYFIIAMHGIEYAINMGGSTIEGYIDWLKRNNGVSPLYVSAKERERCFKGYREKIDSLK